MVKVKDEGLVIPSASPAPGADPATSVGANPGGAAGNTTPTEPHVKLAAGSWNFEMALAPEETGATTLLSATTSLDGSTLTFVRSLATNTNTGVQYYPVFEAQKVAGAWTLARVGSIEKGYYYSSTYEHYYQLTKFDGGYFFGEGNDWGEAYSILDATFKSVFSISTSGSSGAHGIGVSSLCGSSSPKLFTSRYRLPNNVNRGSYFVAPFQIEAAQPLNIASKTYAANIPPFSGWKTKAWSNTARSLGCTGDSLWIHTSTAYIYRANLNYVPQEKFAVSRLLLPLADLQKVGVLGIEGKPHFYVPTATGIKVLPLELIK